jgi:hypothetical protein
MTIVEVMDLALETTDPALLRRLDRIEARVDRLLALLGDEPRRRDDPALLGEGAVRTLALVRDRIVHDADPAHPALR